MAAEALSVAFDEPAAPGTGTVRRMMGEDPRNDGDLLVAMAAGDRDALRVLYERHAPWLMLRLARRCADRGVVDEVVQDTFLAAWRQADRYRGTGEVAAWLWGIGVRRLIDRFRRRGLPTTALGEPAGVTASAEDEVLLDVGYGDLAAALQRLSPEFRAVVQATVLDGLTTREAAALLGIPTGTVKTRMMRARAQLREALA
jgi:RNA polymerase sigma-70 factor (ECF subfamily)